MQIVTIKSCLKGGGGGLVSSVMDCLPEDIKDCVYDSTDGEAKTFGSKLAEKHPNIVRD